MFFLIGTTLSDRGLSLYFVTPQFTHLVKSGAVEVVVLVVGGRPTEGTGPAGVEEEQVEGEAAGEHGGSRSRGQDCDRNSSAAGSLLSGQPRDCLWCSGPRSADKTDNAVKITRTRDSKTVL